MKDYLSPTFQSILLGLHSDDVFIFVAQHDVGLHDLPSGDVRTGHHGGLLDRLVLYQGGLHLEGSDPVSRGDDKIVLTREEPEVPVLVLNPTVSGEIVVSAECICCSFRILTVPLRETMYVIRITK